MIGPPMGKREVYPYRSDIQHLVQWFQGTSTGLALFQHHGLG